MPSKKILRNAFSTITASNKLPVLCGGTGMYIHSLLQNHEYTAVPVNQALRQKLIDLTLADLQAILTTYPPALWQHADQSTHKRLIRAIEIAAYLNDTSAWMLNPGLVFEPLVIGLTSSSGIQKSKELG